MPNRAQSIRDMIDVEVFLFDGIPEQPNPVYGRDSYQSVLARRTRSEVERSLPAACEPSGELLQKITIDFDKDLIAFSAFKAS